MRRALLTALLAGAALAAPASAHAAPKAEVMVVGKAGVLEDAQRVTLKARTATVGRKRCAVAGRTPLSALLATGLPVKYTDYGACSRRRVADAASLYVRSVAGQAARGTDGWVYKVGARAGSAGGADPSGPFGDGRALRGGAKVLWFWCVKAGGASCQRTLDVRATVSGGTVTATVRGYDDEGKGVAIAGADVTLGEARAVTGPDGTAVLTAPATSSAILRASKPGLVPSFPRTVALG